MSEKVELNGQVWRIAVFSKVRKTCDACLSTHRKQCVSLRIFAPEDKKKDIRLCYDCFLDYCLDIHERKRESVEKNQRQETNRARLKNLEKAREVLKEKRDGVLPQVLADDEGQTSETKKKDGKNRARSGGAVDNIEYLTSPQSP